VIFAIESVEGAQGTLARVVFVDAPSFYDAREWGRAKYGERLQLVLAHTKPILDSDGPVLKVGAVHQTPYERESEHRESITARAYEKGLKVGIERGREEILRAGPGRAFDYPPVAPAAKSRKR